MIAYHNPIIMLTDIKLLTFIFGWILLGISSMTIGVVAFIELIIYLTKSEDEYESIYVEGSKPWL